MRTGASLLLFPLLVTCGCSRSDDLHVTAYRNVSGAESTPWPDGCLATVENRTQRFVGVFGVPCKNIQIGDKAVFNHKGDTVFWVNDQPFNVRSAETKGGKE